MALPAVHKLAAVHITAHMPDCSSATASNSVIGVRVPFRALLMQVSMTQQAQITSANAVITIKKNSTTVNGQDSNATTNNVLTILTANAAQTITTYTPNVLTHVVAGDVIVFSSDHGSSTACPCCCEIVLLPE